MDSDLSKDLGSLIEKEKQLEIDIDIKDSYLQSYPYLLTFISNQSAFNETSLYICAHAVYGWMPTVLHLYEKHVPQAIKVLNIMKHGKSLDERDIDDIAKAVNNSVVGASKLLHFANDEVYPMWDSKICKVVFRNSKQSTIKKPANYITYYEWMTKLVAFPEYDPAHKSICSKLRYNVSKIRSLELILFYGFRK